MSRPHPKDERKKTNPIGHIWMMELSPNKFKILIKIFQNAKNALCMIYEWYEKVRNASIHTETPLYEI